MNALARIALTKELRKLADAYAVEEDRQAQWELLVQMRALCDQWQALSPPPLFAKRVA